MKYLFSFCVLIVSFFCFSCTTTEEDYAEYAAYLEKQRETMQQNQVQDLSLDEDVYNYFLVYDYEFYTGNLDELLPNSDLTTLTDFLKSHNIEYKLKSFFSQTGYNNKYFRDSDYYTTVRIYVENKNELQTMKDFLIEKQKESNFQQNTDWNSMWKFGREKEKKEDKNITVTIY